MDDHPENNLECSDIQDDLEMLVLGELPSDRQLFIEDHLAVCDYCRGIEQDYRMFLHEIMHSAPIETSGASLAASIQSAVRTEIATQENRGFRRRTVLTVASVAAVLLFGMVGFHAYQHNRTKAPAADEIVARKSPVTIEKWRYHDQTAQSDAPGEIPVVRGNVFYSLQQGSERSQIHAIDIQSGKLLWMSRPKNIGFLAADDSRAFGLARQDPRRLSLVAMDAATGDTAWRYTQESPNRLEAPYHPRPLANGTLSWIVNSQLHVLDSATGKPIWVRPIPNAGALSGVLVNGPDLYIATANVLHCLDAQSGDELWTKTLDRNASSYKRPIMALAEQEIYIVRQRLRRPPQVLCIDLERRKVLWKKTVGSLPQSILATEQGVFLRSGRILALSRENGRQIWSYPTAGCGPMTLRDRQIHFVSAVQDGQVIALDQSTGREMWHIGGLRSCSSFTLIGDTGYIQTNDGAVRAISLAIPGQS
ncbi:MAG: PQQ-binding-like beta-propeller repeat protein [Phycisphaerae bacterium]|jgi:outer membrane protein assembly factor BamB|nr:PQQ-binding-like beta-propeller repeat protein [Phycisphaerae bacterium]